MSFSEMFLALGGGNEIGASCYLYQLGTTRLLVDAGMRLNRVRAFPDFNRLAAEVGDAGALDAFLLTHAHLDHCGALARLQFEAPHVPKIATAATLDLVRVILGDALRGRGREPEDWQYARISQEYLRAALGSFQVVEYGRSYVPASASCQITPVRAGHILGAAGFVIETTERRLLHTGDISLHGQRAIPGMDTGDALHDIDVLIVESTYAYQPAFRQDTVDEQNLALAEAIAAIVVRGGRVVVPAIAVGRAQEIACLLSDYFEQGLIAPFPVVMDGLVKPVCEVYNQHRSLMTGRQRTKPGHAIYGEWVTPTPDRYHPDPESIHEIEPCCIIASSGMLLDGTRSAQYAAALLARPENALFFSGYLDDESPGRRVSGLAHGAVAVIDGKQVAINGLIHKYHLTAHAPSQDLRRLIDKVQPKQLILMHGDYRYTGDAEFTRYLMDLGAQGVQVHRAANGVPVYL